jgi:hypothetical protein
VAERKVDLASLSASNTRTATSIPNVLLSVSNTPDGSDLSSSLRKVREVVSSGVIAGRTVAKRADCQQARISAAPNLLL